MKGTASLLQLYIILVTLTVSKHNKAHAQLGMLVLHGLCDKMVKSTSSSAWLYEVKAAGLT